MARGGKAQQKKAVGRTLSASVVSERRDAPTPAQRIAAALERKPAAVAIPKAAERKAPPVPTTVARPTTTAAPINRAPVATTTAVSRASAFQSMQRAPSAPAQVPTIGHRAGVPQHVSLKAGAKVDARRQYPRAEVHVRAQLSLADDPSHVFEATLPTLNLSVGGMFLESSFFLKMGTKLLITLQLPNHGREVKVKGEVVRVETAGKGPSGFALRFNEYLDGSQVILATHFLSPVLREFLSQYAKEHRFDASPQYLAHTADVLAAWELKKAELGGDVWDLFSTRS